MGNRLSELLETRDWLLADGATGTNLFAMGLAHGDTPDLWNLDEPEKIRAHYRSFIEAGSDIVLTNSFGGTANRLKLHGADDRVYEINKAAAELLADEIKKSGRTVVCAGSIGPTGDLFEPVGDLIYEDGVAAFVAQIQGLKDGGADVAWMETMSAEIEVNAALEAAEKVGLPAVTTMSFDTNGRTMMGVTPLRMTEFLHEHTHSPIACGGNCGTGASDLLAGLVSLNGKVNEETILIAKANAGIPEFVKGEIQYSGTPELMADFARLARDSGARIIGGCCGTTPEHVTAMKAALEAHEKRDCPSVDLIIEKIGPLTGKTGDLLNTEPGQAATSGRRRNRRRNKAA